MTTEDVTILYDSEGFSLSIEENVLSVFCKKYLTNTESGISQYDLREYCGRTVVTFEEGISFFSRYVEHVPTEAFPIFIALLPSF